MHNFALNYVESIQILNLIVSFERKKRHLGGNCRDTFDFKRPVAGKESFWDMFNTPFMQS